MATIKRGINREQESHFGLYRTSAGGDQEIIVRRKVGEPSDYMHKNSRSLARQREVFSLASRHYASLTPSQKGISRHQFEEVEYQRSHGKTDIKILTGRELYVAKEVRSLRATQKQIVLPYEFCIMLVDEDENPQDGELWLYCTVAGEWFDLPKAQIGKGCWLFSKVPPGYAPYRIYGVAPGLGDLLLPEHQNMTIDYLKTYHYHILYGEQETYCYLKPPGATLGSQRGGWRRAQFFRPLETFNLKTIEITLRRHYVGENRWPETAFISLYNLTYGRIPLDPPLCTAPFTLIMPPYPELQLHTIPIPNITLGEGQEYAWVFGIPPPYDSRKAVKYLCGGTGTCWVYGSPTHAWSDWLGEEWSVWHTYNTAYMCYEMKG